MTADRSPKTITELKMHFFNTSIADIYRAIQGHCYLGAFTLSMCAIDAMAYLHHEDEETIFTSWVKKYLPSYEDDKTRSRILWWMRCGLVHAHGYSDRGARGQEGINITDYTYTRNNPHRHWETDNDGKYTLNLDSFVAEVTVAACTFFNELELELQEMQGQQRPRAVLARANKFVYVDEKPSKSFATLPNLFDKTQAVLAYLDEEKAPQTNELAERIRSMYPPEPREQVEIQSDPSASDMVPWFGNLDSSGSAENSLDSGGSSDGSSYRIFE